MVNDSLALILLLVSNITTNFHRISEDTDFNAVNSPYNSLETDRERPSSRFPNSRTGAGSVSPSRTKFGTG
jgi:hypothetical protein